MGELIKPLHGLRGIAALTVVAGHYGFPGSASFGVVLFFVLSGYLMGRLYLPKTFDLRSVWIYLSARFARVYPLFAFVVIGVALINVYTGASIFKLEPWQVDDHLLLYGSNRTIWTICVEFQFYGLFVLFWWLTSKFGYPRLWATGTVFLGLLWATLTYDPTERMDILGYLHVFAIGILIALFDEDLAKFPKRWAHIGLIVSLALYGVVYMVARQLSIDEDIFINPWAVAVCGAILVFTMAAGDCWANRMLSLKPAVWLGEISFGMYLLHRPVQALIYETGLNALHPIAKVSLAMAIVLVVSHLALKLLEEPARNALRDWSHKILSYSLWRRLAVWYGTVRHNPKEPLGTHTQESMEADTAGKA